MDIYTRLSELIREQTDAVLCTVTFTKGSTPRKAGSKMIVLTDRSIVGTIGGGSVEYQVINDAMDVLRNRVPDSRTYQLEEDLGMHCGGTVSVFFDPILSKPNLFIFGAGHIGRVLARFASEFGFSVRIFDEREDIVKQMQDSGFSCSWVKYQEAVVSLPFSHETYTVIVTPKHEHDEMLVSVCARRPFAYLGMIGSKAKVNMIRNKLRDEYGVPDETINAIDMPVGIPFEAETPEEIAISILARLIDVKNKRNKAGL